MSSETNTRNVAATRVFDAPVGQVWRAWSEPEQVKRWWGPHGFTVPVANMDFREGGASLVCMRAPAEYGGMDLYNTWTYSKIDPQARIEFVLRFTDANGTAYDPAQRGMPAGVPPAVPHVITFKALGDRQTEMTVTEYGYTSDQAHDISLSGLVECLDKMAASFQPGA